MMERVQFEPKNPPSNPAARLYVPKYIYSDPENPSSIEIREEFYGSRRKLRVGVLGGGIATIQFLHSLETVIPAESVEVVVYCRDHDVGGVWCTSRYPGCRSDIPGAMYQFEWRPQIWKEWLPSASEMHEYLRAVARENDFYRYMKLQHEIIRAEWNDETCRWKLTVNDLASGTTFDDDFDVFVELNGPVSGRARPVKGITNFRGKYVHTAEWEDGLNLRDKKVALLGYGSTGVQIAPEIVREASCLYTWFRSRTYILPPQLPEFAGLGGANFQYLHEQQELLSDPDVYRAYRKSLNTILYEKFPANVNGNMIAHRARQEVLRYMRTMLSARPDIYDKIHPESFDIGCRRVTPNHGYLETLMHPKTTVFFEEPTNWTDHGFIDSRGKEHPIDIVIAATGYDQSHLPRYTKIVNGEDIRRKWSQLKSPPSYMSVCFEGMPNYFNASSTYAAVNGSWFPVVATLTTYMVKFISKMQTDKITRFQPKPIAVKHFVQHADAFLERFVQSGPCSAWHKTATGRPALWPGNRTHVYKVLETPRYEDFELTYEDEENMFGFLGNGFVEGYDDDVKEKDRDLAWYIADPEREVGKDVLEKLKGVHGIHSRIGVINEEAKRGVQEGTSSVLLPAVNLKEEMNNEIPVVS